MTRRSGTIDASYFDKLYAEHDDPWSFQTSAYERDKYERTLAAAPRAHYDKGLEIGCSIGVLTRRLAARCGQLVSTDASERPLARARQICADVENVTFLRMSAPRDWPEGAFDLIVFSEVLYYFDRADLKACAQRVAASLAPGGDIVLVHYTGETDYPLSGDEAATMFGAEIGAFAQEMASERRDRFRIDVWRRRESSI